MLTVYRQELRMQRGSWVTWTVVLLCLATIYLSVYPAFAHDAQAVTEAFGRLPQAIRNAMGTGGFRLLSFPGFIANILPIFMLAGGIQAVSMGISMLNRERLAGTSDFLMAKPLTRSSVFWQKLLANLSILAITSIVLVATLLIGAHLANAEDFSTKTFLMVMAAFSLVQCWFFAVGIALSQGIGRIRNSIGVSIALCFGLFVLAMFSSVIGDETIRYLTPYKYIDLMKVVQDATYDTGHLVVATIIVVVCFMGSWAVFKRRDTESAR